MISTKDMLSRVQKCNLKIKELIEDKKCKDKKSKSEVGAKCSNLNVSNESTTELTEKGAACSISGIHVDNSDNSAKLTEDGAACSKINISSEYINNSSENAINQSSDIGR